ncbi:MAG: hypothetical protein OEY19_03640 [Gammaproteobacteria bacterium]|nr:hypothetical protein [Gammaproteobacteria bacterium]
MVTSSTEEISSTMVRQPIPIGVRIFDEIKRKRLEQTIRMFNKLKGDIWQLTPAGDAQVVIFSPEEAGGEVFLKSALDNNKIHPVIYAKKNNSTCPWFIDQAGGSLACMNTLADVFRSINKKKHKSTESSAENKSNDINPFINRIKSLTRSQIVYKNLLSIYVNVDSEEVCIEKPQLNSIALDKLRKVFETIGIGNIEVREISSSEFEEGKAKSSIADLSLSNFFWEMAINDKQASLFDETKASKYKLERWPNFTRLQHKYEHVVLAAFFRRFAADIDTASAKTGIPAEVVVSFLNATHLLGIEVIADENSISFTKEANLTPKAPKTVMQKVLGTLFKEKIH